MYKRQVGLPVNVNSAGAIVAWPVTSVVTPSSIASTIGLITACALAVSYTHLDVYKRQVLKPALSDTLLVLLHRPLCGLLWPGFVR